MSNLMHKVKDAVSGHHSEDKHSSTVPSSTQESDTYHESQKGPIDFAPGTTTGNRGAGSHAYAGGHESSTINAGPHDSKAANKLDPRVDSDLDNRGAYGSTTGTGSYGTTDTYGGGTTAPHDSKMANKVDPRVDTLDNRATQGGTTGAPRTGGTGAPRTGGTGAHGYNTRSANTGANVTSQMEPRQTGVDTDQPGFGGNAAGGSSYNAPAGSRRRKSSGPHSSELLNKLDPRVHSSDNKNTNAPGHQRGY